MYLEHFGLREAPFSMTPDTAFFMNRAGYQDALNVLLVALRSGEGFVKVAGEVGVGKTTLCRKLLATLGDDFVTVYLHYPCLDPDALLLAIADELGVACVGAAGGHAVLKRITSRLIQHARAGRRVVLCLDEAQAMPVAALETVRLLTNLETEKRKLLQVVLFGQPELDTLLDRPSVRQLRQRITFCYRLEPLNRAGVIAYVRHRLAVARCQRPPPFSRGALDQLVTASEGIPRLINILCHKALLAAYGEGATRVGEAHMRAAMHDTSAASAQAGRARRSATVHSPMYWGVYWGVYWGLCGSLAVAVLILLGLRAGELLALAP